MISRLTFAAAIFLAALTAAEPAHAWTRETVEGSSQGLFWPGMPVAFSINKKCFDKDGSQASEVQSCIDAVKGSYFAWTAPSCTDMRFKDPVMTDSTAVGGQDGVNLVVWQFDAWNYQKTAFAMTTATYTIPDGEIVDADIEVNGVWFKWKVLSAPDKVFADVANTLTHEAGHVVGLDHSTDMNSVMYPTAKLGEISKRTLVQDDIDGVCAIYPKGSTPTKDGGSGGADGGGGGGGGGGGCSMVRLEI